MRYMGKNMADFWRWVAPAAQLKQWEAEHGPAPDGTSWSGEWRYVDGAWTFLGCTAVPSIGFPVRRPWTIGEPS